MLLSDGELKSAIKSGLLAVDPWDQVEVETLRLLQPTSIDVRLGREFRVFNNHLYTHIDPAVRQDDLTSMVDVADGSPFVLHPGEFVLGSTLEKVTMSSVVAGRLEGKSSLGRLGLLAHSTAGFIDPGFSGHVTLELSNVANLPITLWPGMKIGQMCVFRLAVPAEHPYGSAVYGSHYQGQRGPTASRSWQNWPPGGTS
jgi:dCTP deaminase